MEPTGSWTSYIHMGEIIQVLGMWDAFGSYFIFSNLPRTVPWPEVYHSWCLLQNCPTSTSKWAMHCVSLTPEYSGEADWQSVLFPRGNHELYEPTGDPHSLPSSGFSVDMTHLVSKRSELEWAAVFQRFPFFMDSIDSIWASWNGFPQPLRKSPNLELPEPHGSDLCNKKGLL